MTEDDPSRDLVILVPGNNERRLIDSLLTHRHPSLGIRGITHKTFIHPNRDAGCYLQAPELLRGVSKSYRYALVMLDHEGCGRERDDPREIERDLQQRLGSAGWGNRAEVVVIVPELEAWVWSDSPEVDVALGWEGRVPPLRKWLEEEDLWGKGEQKPNDPKGAVERALREVHIPRSSSVYEALAKTVSLRRCSDPSFARLTAILQGWFKDVTTTA